MKEKELRIALVCFGGASLAVYMHGISKEILKLVRASSMLHSIVDRAERSKASFLDKVDRKDSEYDTDAIYFELLRDIGRTLELRVIVDIVAGASAGGINGTMLARALSHDLPMGALRDLWLDHADVSDLLAPHARARAGSKLVLKPVGGSIEKLDAWLHDAQLSGIYAMQRFARAARQDIDAVLNAVLEPWSNGQTEGQINQLKAIKRAMYGRAGIELLRARMIPLYQVDLHQE